MSDDGHALVVGREHHDVARRVDRRDVAAPAEELDGARRADAPRSRSDSSSSPSPATRKMAVGMTGARPRCAMSMKRSGRLTCVSRPTKQTTGASAPSPSAAPRRAAIRWRGENDAGRNDRVLVAPTDPGREELVANLRADRDQAGGGPGQRPLDAGDELGLRRREVPAEQMAVEVVHRRRDPARPRGGPAQHAGLGLVGVDDVRPEVADDLRHAPQRLCIVPGMRRATQTLDALDAAGRARASPRSHLRRGRSNPRAADDRSAPGRGPRSTRSR